MTSEQTSTLPTIVLIHGCFSTPACFEKLESVLASAGYPVLKVDYPSSTQPDNASEVTAQKDVESVRKQYLLPLVEGDGKDIILVAHSFGGVVAGGAAVGLSKTDRAVRGLGGGVLGLVYVVGNIVHQGETLLATCGGQWPDWFKKDHPREGFAIIDNLLETMYHDHDTAKSEQNYLEQFSIPHAYQCLATKAPAQCWMEAGYSGRLAYIHTTLDKVNPLFAQELWVRNTKVEWDVVSMEASHAPYISQPKELARLILHFTDKFLRVGIE